MATKHKKRQGLTPAQKRKKRAEAAARAKAARDAAAAAAAAKQPIPKSSALTAEQNAFVLGVSNGTGLNMRVVAAWVLGEGGPNDNPLNIGPGNHYGSTDGAVKATVELLKSSTYSGIMATVGQSDQAQISAIVASPWCPHCPGYSTLLHGTYGRVSDLPADTPSPVASGTVGESKSALDAVGDAIDTVGGVPGDIANLDPVEKLATVLEPVGRFLQGLGELLLTPEGWKRIGLLLGGVVLIVWGGTKLAGVTLPNPAKQYLPRVS